MCVWGQRRGSFYHLQARHLYSDNAIYSSPPPTQSWRGAWQIIRHNQKFVPDGGREGGGGLQSTQNRLHDGMSFLFLPCFFALPVCVTHMTHTGSKMCKKCAAAKRRHPPYRRREAQVKVSCQKKYRQKVIFWLWIRIQPMEAVMREWCVIVELVSSVYTTVKQCVHKRNASLTLEQRKRQASYLSFILFALDY